MLHACMLKQPDMCSGGNLTSSCVNAHNRSTTYLHLTGCAEHKNHPYLYVYQTCTTSGSVLLANNVYTYNLTLVYNTN